MAKYKMFLNNIRGVKIDGNLLDGAEFSELVNE